VTYRRAALIRAIAFALLTPVALLLGWVYSVAFVSVLSIWALVEACYAAWRADEAETLDRIEAKLDQLLDWPEQ